MLKIPQAHAHSVKFLLFKSNSKTQLMWVITYKLAGDNIIYPFILFFCYYVYSVILSVRVCVVFKMQGAIDDIGLTKATKISKPCFKKKLGPFPYSSFL